MKTDGLTFTEAVQALSEKKCEGIENQHGARYWINNIGVISYKGRAGQGIISSPVSFLGKWRLIGVKQKVVYNGIKWNKCNDYGVIYPISMTDITDWSRFLNKPGMKVTLEWPE